MACVLRLIWVAALTSDARWRCPFSSASILLPRLGPSIWQAASRSQFSRERLGLLGQSETRRYPNGAGKVVDGNQAR